jgi:hypothetical protein
MLIKFDTLKEVVMILCTAFQKDRASEVLGRISACDCDFIDKGTSIAKCIMIGTITR